MKHTPQSIEQFLRAFESTGNPDEAASQASQFAETFLVAGPDGSRAIRASDFALALPRRRKMFEEWGLRATRLDSVSVTNLNERYAMAEARWSMTFAYGEGKLSDVSLGSTYLLDTKDELKILFYLSHQEISAVLRERGILQS